MKAFVTGGAGFIASHIVDKLLEENNEVIIYDNFSTGQEKFIMHHKKNPKVNIIKADVLDLEKLKYSMNNTDFVFHFQANADVRGGIANNFIDIEQNTICTYNVLESMRINKIKNIAFSSSATVYGDPELFPTPENYPLIQTSTYGASKVSGESLIEAFCEYYNIKCWIFRFVSFIGERYTHGVIFDFMKKLFSNPNELEILGDGNQKKSYLHVEDGVEAIFFAINNAKKIKNIFNLGHNDYINVVKLAGIILEEMHLNDVKYSFTGGEKGWKGDSPFVLLDTTNIKNLGWFPKISIEEGIKRTVKYLISNKDLFNLRN